MFKKEIDKIFGDIISRNLKTSPKAIILEAKKFNIYNSDRVQIYLKKILKNKSQAKQITYDTMLECEGFIEPGYSKDARYIKHKDRKEGWWD